MTNHLQPTARLQAVQSYLETVFPGRVEETIQNMIAVSHHGLRHHVVLQPTFLHLCPNYLQAIRESELVNYIHEARSQSRRFVVSWKEPEIRLQSTALRAVKQNYAFRHQRS